MKFGKLLRSSLLLSVLLPTVVVATPTKYSKCALQIIEPQNSSGYFLSDDCQMAYILPPKQSQILINGYNPTVSSTTCVAIDALEESNALNSLTEKQHAKTVQQKSQEITELEDLIASGDIPQGTTEEQLMDEVVSLQKKIEESLNLLFSSYDRYIKRKGDYSVMEGGYGSFALVSDYSNLVNEFAELNKELDVHFIKIPLKTNYVSIIEKDFDQDDNRVEMKAVKRLRLASGDLLPLMNDVSAIVEGGVGYKPASGVQKSIFSEGISGEIEFSALGSCSLNRELGSMSDFDLETLETIVNATAFYEYEVEVKRRYSVTYNFKEFVHILRETSKKGGFFSRKTLTRLIDNRKTSSWIEFHSQSNDSTYEYSDEDIKAIKAEFMDRALRQIIDVRSDGKASALALIDPTGKNGATAIADELKNCPHVYCQIGAAGFRVLDSIFGSTKATSELLKTIEGEAHETVEEKKMVKLVGSSTFQ